MSIESLFSLITGGAGALAVMTIIFALILSDKLHTDGEFRRIVQANEKKDLTIAELTKALDAAATRADAAVKASEMIADAFSSAGSRRRNVQDDPR